MPNEPSSWSDIININIHSHLNLPPTSHINLIIDKTIECQWNDCNINNY